MIRIVHLDPVHRAEWDGVHHLLVVLEALVLQLLHTIYWNRGFRPSTFSVMLRRGRKWIELVLQIEPSDRAACVPALTDLLCFTVPVGCRIFIRT